MSDARINFADHQDGTFSCQAIWKGEFNALSPSHQMVHVLREFVDAVREGVPGEVDDEVGEVEDGNRPTLPTEAFMQFSDTGDNFRLKLQYLPKEQGFNPKSPAHQACRQAHALLEYMSKAVSDAIITRPGSIGVMSVKAKHAINAENGH